MFEKLRSTLARAIGPKDKSLTKLAAAYAGQRGDSAYVDRTQRAALEANAKANVLHGVILKISESVASTEWTLSRVKGTTNKQARTQSLKRTKTFDAHQKLASDADLETVEAHEVLDLLARGNSQLNGFDTIQLFASYLDLCGEAFLVKERDNGMRVTELWAVPPTWVSSIPDALDQTYTITINGFRRVCLAEDVIWCKIPDPRAPYKRGFGATMALANELVTDEYAAEFIQAFFYNGAMPDAVIGFVGAQQPEIDAVNERWAQRHRGQKKSHRLAFVAREPKIVKLDAQFKDSNVVTLRKYLRDEVLQQFGMPPEIMGILNDSNRATISGAETIFARWVLVPRIMRIVRCLQEQLIDPIDPTVVLWFISPVPKDEEQQLKVMVAQPSSFTRGDWRRAAKHDATDADEVYTIKPPVVLLPAGDETTGAITMPDRGADEKTKSLRHARVRAARNDVEAVIAAVEASLMSDGVEDIWAPQMQTLYGETYGKLGLDSASVMRREAVAADITRLKDVQLGYVDDTTRAALSDTLTAGVANGEGALDLAERVNEVFDFCDSVRAERIARTEVAASSNYTTYTAHKDSGLVDKREWITVGPPRSRASHITADEQMRGIDEEFNVGSATGLMPGHMSDANENFRCRCTTVPVFELSAAALSVAKGQEPTQKDIAQARKNLADAFDARNTPWIDEGETFWRSGFAQQREDTLAAVKRIFPVY